MISPEEQVSLVRSMEAHERAMGRLYRAYAQRFPEQGAVWHKLAQAEMEHAEWVRDLAARMKDGSVRLSGEHHALADLIQTSRKEIEGEEARVKSPKMLSVEAVSAALRLERSMLEKEWFKSLSGDSDLIQRVLKALAAETDKHISELENLLPAGAEASSLAEPQKSGLRRLGDE